MSLTKILALPAAFLICVGAAASASDLTGDAAAGEKVFKKCRACHEVGADAKSKVGPELNDVVGRKAASVADFKYSKGLTEKAAAEDLVWTPENLDAFLTKPKEFVDGTKMSFPGLRKEEERADLIAYLASLQ
jgi:cytochrome c